MITLHATCASMYSEQELKTRREDAIRQVERICRERVNDDFEFFWALR